MPRSRSTSRTTLVRLVFLALVGWALVALRRRDEGEVAEAHVAPLELDAPATSGLPGARASLVRARKNKGRRLATSLAFATLFFAGAALSAGAGDSIVRALEGDTTTAEATTTEPDPAAEAAPEPASEPEIPPADEAAPLEELPAEAPPAAESAPGEGEAPAGEAPVEGEAPAEQPVGEAPANEPAAGEPVGEQPAAAPEAPSGAPAPAAGEGSAAAPSGQERTHDENKANPQTGGPPLLVPHSHEADRETRAVDPEAEGVDGFATIWLHRSLPDPTPPAKRLAPEFAKTLVKEARRAGIRWSTLLGGVRADGKGGRVPTSRAHLRSMARKLAARKAAGEWQAFLALRGRTAFADRAQALARYNRAVGLEALVVGLDASKAGLEERVLADRRLDIYGGGRSDILAGRIDVRVLVLLRYMAESHGQVTVSSLHSGHRLYARPGVVSAHIYGLAVDISALGGRAIIGSNQPGGLTEHGVRNILLLPAELRPQQLISLFGMGGPSFPMANHADHIHVGY